jgi:hypothetical protein
MSVLDAVETSLKDFRPKTHRQFVVFNIAMRFNDVPNLARYLNLCYHPKKDLLEAARGAELESFRTGQPAVEPFFRRLAERDRKEAA